MCICNCFGKQYFHHDNEYNHIIMNNIYRELAGGKGFADIVFVPRKKFPEKPALVVELKWDKKVDATIEQIKRKEYCQSLKEYQGNILLVGINYSKRTKKHQCIIEEYQKS